MRHLVSKSWLKVNSPNYNRSAKWRHNILWIQRSDVNLLNVVWYSQTGTVAGHVLIKHVSLYVYAYIYSHFMYRYEFVGVCLPSCVTFYLVCMCIICRYGLFTASNIRRVTLAENDTQNLKRLTVRIMSINLIWKISMLCCNLYEH